MGYTIDANGGTKWDGKMGPNKTTPSTPVASPTSGSPSSGTGNVYGLAKDVALNQGSQLYVPGQTQMGAGDVFLGGTGTGVTDAQLNGASRVYGATAQDTANAYSAYKSGQNPQSVTPAPTPTPPPDYTALMKQSLADQQTAQTTMYNQQATDQATKIRQALASQSQQADATKADYTNQMNTAIGTLNTERAKIPGQTTTLNNTDSFQGMNNEQQIRNSLAQMGLLQSGESASQQLTNDMGTANRINANNLQGQQLDTNFGNQIASSQTELASKVKAINDAMAVAQASGDENALSALTNAQNQIALSAAQNNLTMNNFQYQTSKDAGANNQWQQSFDQQKAQDIANNAFNESQLTGYYGGVHYVNGVPQAATTSNDTYGTQADINANPGKNIQLYVPGQTQLGAGDVFLGGTAVLGNDKLGGATRIAGNDAQATSDAYKNYMNGVNATYSTGNTYARAADMALNPGARLYVPGTTKLATGDVFLGGTAVLGDNLLNGATRIAGMDANATSDAYKNYLAGKSSMAQNQQNSNSSSALPPSISSQYPGATNVVKTGNGYKFTSSTGNPVYYAGQ